MPKIEFQGKQIEVTEGGYLVHLEDWSRQLAEHLAKNEGIALTPDHWWFIDYIRSYYLEYGIEPFIKYLIQNAEKSLGAEKGCKRYMYKLFPPGPLVICKLAGIPRPIG
jgi:TusE/DsrC/DsvC family sulfur relay protein